MSKTGPKPVPFWDRVNKSDGCWQWTGGLFPNGYGSATVNRKAVGAHRRWNVLHGRSWTEVLA